MPLRRGMGKWDEDTCLVLHLGHLRLQVIKDKDRKDRKDRDRMKSGRRRRRVRRVRGQVR